MATRMQQRRGTAAQWISTNSGNGPVLNAGEIGFEIDNNRFKIGDGVNHWVDLPYFSDNQSLTDLIDGAPALLDTLGELAAAIGDDPDFVGTVTDHTSATTNVHGIADTADLATQEYVTDAIAGATVDQAALAGEGITWNESTDQYDIDSTVATLTGTQTLTNKTLTSPVINTPTGITKSDVGLSNVNNTSDDNKPISTAAQSALDLKAPIESPTFTGTVTGVTKAMVGLGNADNTSDANKPISTAAQTALDLKAPKHNAALTGTATTENLTVNGDFTVNGTNFSASATSITIEDNLVQLAHQNPSNTVDLGLVVAYNDGVSGKHSGLVRDVSENTWKLFKNVTTEPTTVVDFTQGSLDDIQVAGLQATSAVIGSVNNTEIQYLNGVTSAIQDQIDDKLAIADAESTYAPIESPTFTGTVSGITKTMVGLSNVDNTADADKDISTLTQQALDLKAPLANPTFTGLVSGVTKGMVGLGNVDNTSDANKPVSSATQTALNLKSNLASPTFTGTVVLPTATSIGEVSSTEIEYLNGVTSPIQTQMDLKIATATVQSLYAPKANPTFTGTVSGITKSMVGLANVDNTSDADKPISDDTQAALDLKAPLANPTFTGTVSGITKSMVGLGSVDNTSDANKPISTATQTALDLKAPLASPTFTGTVTLPTGTVTSGMILDGTIVAGDLADGAVTSAKILDGTIVNGDINASAAIDWTKLAISSTVSATEAGYLDGVTSAIQTQINSKANLSGATFTGNVEVDGNLVVDGDFTVNGTNFSASATSITIEDNLVQLAHQNSANTVDLGLVVAYNDGSAKHAGIVRDVSDSKWKLFKGVATEPSTTVAFTEGSLDDLAVGAFEASSATIGNVSNTELQYLDGVTSAIQTQINAKANTASPSFTGTVTIPNGASLGTPASATLTNATGLPVSTGISGFGTGVATFLATPSSANLASMLTDEIGTGNVVLSEVATSAQTASYTLVAADRAKMVEMNVSTANNVTVPPNSSVPFPVGTKIDVLQVGAGQTTIVAGAGVTVNATPGLKLRAQWSSATLIKRAENTWVLVGDISA